MPAASSHQPETDACLPVAAPRRVREDQVEWAHHCDVLIAGFGAAGAATAISAQEASADALICERFDGGGASRLSGGVVYAGGGTPHQQAAGFSDTPAAMYQYLSREVGDAVSAPTLRRFCDDSTALLAWLEGLGVRFASESNPPKTSYPRDGVYLYFSGNEAVPENAAVAPPAPRGHRVVAKGMAGAELFRVLREAVVKRDIPVLTQTAVRRLLLDETGAAVIGAEVAQLAPGSRAARRHARLMRWAERCHNAAPGIADRLRRRAMAVEQAHAHTRCVRARRGVVLTTGGFIFNRSMISDHAPAYLGNMRLGATGCDGSGIRLGAASGGTVARMNKVSAWRFINPPQSLPQGVIVNRRGARFCNEEVYGATLGVRMCEDHDGKAWLILDKTIRARAIREALFGKLWAFQSIPALLLMLFAPRARTLPALAQRIGADTSALQDAVQGLNTAIAAAAPDPFAKSDKTRRPLQQPPFFALDISASNRLFPCPAITLGGLRVDEESGHVLNGEGAAIDGLFAAGRAAVGIASNGYVSGLSLADCLWSGRRAGHAAARAAKPSTTTSEAANAAASAIERN